MESNLWTSIVENTLFAVEFLGMAVLMLAIAIIAERIINKKEMKAGPGGTAGKVRILTTRKIAVIGVFSAIATIFHIFDFPLPFLPSFYRLDFSEIPALIGAFAFGPVAGVMIEFCKIILKLLTKGTSTAFVGDLANFTIGCSYLLPASIIYSVRKNKKAAVIGCVVGTVAITAFGTLLNAFYLIPMFEVLFFGGDSAGLMAMSRAANPLITDTVTLALLAAGPINLIKGISASAVTLLIYKKLSPLMKEGLRRNAR